MKQLVMTGLMTGVMAAGLAATATAQEKAAEKTPEKVSWADSIKVSGDARFRYQDTALEDSENREQWRFRGRIGLDAKVNDQVKANLRLVTNKDSNPVSDNITMDNSFDDKNAAFDRVFFTYSPVELLGIRFGKMSQPWIVVDDLVMSGDVNPEGMAVNAKLPAGSMELLAHGGAYVIDERSADDESMLYSGQVAAKANFGKKDFVMAGATVYAYDNIEGMGLQYDATKGFGNSTTKIVTTKDGVESTTLEYATEYTVVEGFVQASIDVGVPLTLGAQYMVNTDADENDVGYLGMAAVKLPAGFSVGYQYRYLEKDSTLGVFAESTDFGNGTDVEGHIPYVSYDIGKNFNIKTQYAMGDKGLDNGKTIDTFKIDLACKF